MYLDAFDVEEFKLFRKFNNRHERAGRHIDVYHVKDKNDVLKIEYNKEKLREDTITQLQRGDTPNV